MESIEVVERISTQAQKQYGLKSTMKTMKAEWKEMEFGSMEYKETALQERVGIGFPESVYYRYCVTPILGDPG